MAYSFFTAANARLARPIKTLLEEGKGPVPAQLAKYAEVTGGFSAGQRCFDHYIVDCRIYYIGPPFPSLLKELTLISSLGQAMNLFEALMKFC